MDHRLENLQSIKKFLRWPKYNKLPQGPHTGTRLIYTRKLCYRKDDRAMRAI